MFDSILSSSMQRETCSSTLSSEPSMTASSQYERASRRVTIVACCVAIVSAVASRETVAATIEDRAFIAACDGSEQKYVLVMPDGFQRDRPLSVLIALHGHGSDRWQFVRQERGECRAVRDVAAATGSLLVSPDYRATTSWMGPKAEADVVQIIDSIKKQFQVDRVILCGGSMGGTGSADLRGAASRLDRRRCLAERHGEPR